MTQTPDFTHLRRAATYRYGGTEVIADYELGNIVGRHADREGLREGPGGRVYRLHDGHAPKVVNRDRLADWVRRYAAWVAATAAEQIGHGHSVDVLRATVTMLNDPTRSERYVRRLVGRTTDWLTELGDKELAHIRRERRERENERLRQRRATQDVEALNARRREQYRKAKEEEFTELRPRIARWIRKLPPGRHTTTEVWNLWRSQVEAGRDRLVAMGRQDLLRLGRNAFLRIVDSVCPIRTGHRKIRYINTEEIMLDALYAETEALRAYNAEAERMLRLREAVSTTFGATAAEALAATGTDDGRVVSLAKARERRRR